MSAEPEERKENQLFSASRCLDSTKEGLAMPPIKTVSS